MYLLITSYVTIKILHLFLIKIIVYPIGKKIINEFRVLPKERKIKIEARIEAEYDIVMEDKQTRSKNA